MSRLVVVSNRVALPGKRGAKAGGLAVGLRDAVRQYGGLWFGWSGEITDNPSTVPSIVSEKQMQFATLDLTEQEFEAYYNQFANSTLWPLFHYRLGLVEFSRTSYQGYLAVNAKFADALAPLLRPDDVVWIHDYHLLTLAWELRRRGVTNRLGFFLHIPLPGPDILTVLPGHAMLMRGLASNDLIGFQSDRDLKGFQDYILAEAGGRKVNGQELEAFGRRFKAGVFPIGIDVNEFVALAEKSARDEERVMLKQSLGARKLVIGVDRLDYSKGIPNRFEAFEEMLKRFPEHRGSVTLVQIASPSREDVTRYRSLRREIDGLVGRVNGSHAEVHWTPIRYLYKTYPRAKLAGFYRISSVGLVTPLRDGMNLVAMEYVAAQPPDDPGVLVLSRFAGAARLLTGALIVNPYDVDQCAETLDRALKMPPDERQGRWREMMDCIRTHDAKNWRNSFLRDLAPPAPLARAAAL